MPDKSCSLCKSENLITDTESGEVICGKCGMVISDKIQETESRRLLNPAEVSKERAST
jgi:transcription initiation factor TFIIIB Brf1 subunit/transcription initiation factor TFIIB